MKKLLKSVLKHKKNLILLRMTIYKKKKLKLLKNMTEKKKEVEVQKKIDHSNELNKARLSVLSARQNCISEIYTRAQESLASVSSRDNYPDLIANLILEGLIELMEDTVTIICRECDHDIVESVLGRVKNEYEQNTNITSNLVVDRKLRLAPPPDGQNTRFCCGGVLLSAHQGKILCNNTLEQRLALCYEGLLPHVRTLLFGKNIYDNLREDEDEH
eukprot:TRINITY_DN47950_c0_g1_i1.p1 TRINITY_DN47950_c0_g1~~TRINITY_DN47950_c0_g1_i1.p1  ORF type:complete len:216 (-),score=43.30 TRINITY_DN47950_c0_g1_i1:31-678(-)